LIGMKKQIQRIAQDFPTHLVGLARLGRTREEVDGFLKTMRRYR
jgi:hypothetical protein